MGTPDVSTTACPKCGATTLRVVSRLTVKPPGSYALAGTQRKLAAESRAWLVCDSCDLEIEGKHAATDD